MKIALVVMWLFDSYGNQLNKGGSQRYCIQLIRLLSKYYKVRVIQKASCDFSQTVEDVQVLGVRCMNNFFGILQYSYKVRSMLYDDELAIYVYQEAAFPFVHTNSIAIQHGLNWNANNKYLKLLNRFVIQPYLLRRLRRVICVDTAYINWVLTEISSSPSIFEKLKYIPNFVDLSIFNLSCSFNKEKPILFPRRMVIHRGVFLMYDAMKILWSEGFNNKLIYCGRGDASSEILELAKKEGYYDNIVIKEVGFDEMKFEYANALLSVIPTIAYEGTSLSCIESMSTGCPVIVTYIGGLGNLVIPGFNGECVEPMPGKLAKSIKKIIQNEDIWNKYAAIEKMQVKALDINQWNNKWLAVIKEI